MDLTTLYGTGFDYPFSFDRATGGVSSAGAVESVRATLYRLFDTAPGEEFMLPEYGCRLKNLVFSTDTLLFRALADTAIREAVARWEPRIEEVLSVELERDEDTAPHTLNIRVYFRLIQDQSEYNFVYPFFMGA